VLVLWGASNDIAKNNSIVGMRHLLELVIIANHISVIEMSEPHRHDLMSNSCVNKEIEKFHRKLRLRLERLRNVELSEVVNDRILYKRHRQHLNTEGKENMAKEIVSAIEHVLCKQVEPITGKCYTDKASDTLAHQPAQHTMDNNTEVEINDCSNTPGGLDTSKIQDTKIISDTVDRKSPKRPRRQPVTRKSSFFYRHTPTSTNEGR